MMTTKETTARNPKTACAGCGRADAEHRADLRDRYCDACYHSTKLFEVAVADLRERALEWGREWMQERGMSAKALAEVADTAGIPGLLRDAEIEEHYRPFKEILEEVEKSP